MKRVFAKIIVITIFIWMTAKQPKGKAYWMDEIAFLEARLNGSQGDIDADDRKACEEALKVAKVNLSAGKQ